MRSPRGWLGIWIACLAAAGCSWSLNDQADTGLRLYLQRTDTISSQTRLLFDWWDPTASSATYVVERSAAGEEFHPVANLQIGAPGFIVLGPDDPAGPYQFRLRSGLTGNPSNTVSYLRDILPGTLDLAPVQGGFRLTYSALLQRPDAVVLTRTTQLADGTQGPAQTLLTTTARNGTYVDTDLSGFLDGASYSYKLVIRSGGVDAQPLTQKTGNAAAALSEIVSLQVNGAAVHLQVRSTSHLPGTLRLVRGSESPLDVRDPVAIFQVTAPGQVFSADDTLPEPMRYEYQLSFTPQSSGFPTTAMAVAPAVLAPPGWSGRIVTVPRFVEAARASNGELAFLADAKGIRTLIPPGGSVADGFAVPSDYHPNRLLLDATDHPHAVYPEGASLVHLSHDGRSWQKESIGAFALGTPADVTVGADGDLWAAWAGVDARIFVAHRTAAGWTVEQLPSAFVATRPLVVAADESSNPHLAGTDASPFHLFHDQAGWHQEALPGALSFYTVHSPSYIAAVSQKITIVDRETAPPFPGGSPEIFGGIAIYRHDSTGWRREDSGNTSHPPDGEPLLRAAIAPDPFIVSWTEVGAFLYTTGRPESSLLFAEGYQGMPCGVGFKPDGTRWLLYLFRALTTFQIPTSLNAVLYEQTR